MEIDAKTQQPLSPVSPTRSKLRHKRTLNSEIYEHSFKHKYLPPLGLTSDQLQQRVESLKNYQTYKETKAKRIDLHNLEFTQKTPIVGIAMDLGIKSGENQVLLDFIKSHGLKEQNPEETNIFQQFLNNSDHHKKQIKHHKNLSFIDYKCPDEQKLKEFKQVFTTNSSMQLRRKHEKTLTQPKEGVHYKMKTKSVKFPKELKILKNRLKLLPVLSQNIEPSKKDDKEALPSQRYLTETDEFNHLGLHSKHHKSEFFNPQKITNAISLTKVITSWKQREEYMASVKTIIDKSEILLKHDISSTISKRKDSLASQIEVYISNSGLKDQKVSPKNPKKEKQLRYWPKYSEYSISSSDIQKLQKLVEQSLIVSKEGVGIPEEVTELDKIIKKQIVFQQHQMDKHIISSQQNSLGSRFNYLMQLEKQTYKKDVKSLLKCKKEYYLSKRREQIRANGIKRLKKIDNEKVKNVPIEEEKEKDDEYY